MSKSEFYREFIEIQQKTGQGTSGLVAMNSEIAEYIKELIEEGLIVECHTGGSMGHPLSNIFYMPSKGYNVWLDNNGRNLDIVRFYLGLYPMDRVLSGDEDRDNLAKFLHLTNFDFIRNPERLKNYANWLEKNEEELKIMLSLDNFYVEDEIKFNSEEVKYIHDREWYKENLIAEKVLIKSKEFTNASYEKIEITKQILGLYAQMGKLSNEDSQKVKENEEAIIRFESEIHFRKRFNKWLSKQDSEINIKELV